MSIVFEKTDKRTKTPFRADIVGSFLRPQNIKNARIKFKNGEISFEELNQLENKEIIKLVEKQKSVGLKAVTDGEFRRSWWHLDFMWGLDGVDRKIIDEGYKFNGLETRPETAVLTGKIGFSNHPMVSHYKFLKSITGDDVIARQSIPAPAQFLAELQRGENKEITDSIYSSTKELVSDIANAYRKAIKAFYDAGCRSLQLDDCTWGMFCDKKYWEARQEEGLDINEIAKLYAKVNNESLKGHPDDMVITMHVCRGNYHSTWASSGGYEAVAEILFGTVNVDAFYLEYDTDRAGDFAPLRFVKDKIVVLGLISSKIGQLENKEDVIKRIKEATEYIDLNRLCLSTQCGFASTEEGNILTEKQQWDKIRLVKEISDEVW
ncbi:5-methyltetrahydropteroyltriglutamate--homocysteine S-methyltransferase [Clostridium tyrobutyricum]|jgi:methionine synthase II (cobalamin-independent)|uniref:5-methyltetrahydropteroyltriglutamate-- homocysteine S-methyltransferase n=1 Tax=Clostridium tyrobutyricum TaxID=1519 RepID=UPI00057C49C1|nr:5-methyltetrahydropteroyltriglutamate--homocysteine S-methyltransferase [Clostridium tyrobutyricum]MBR9648408.1 5-methyltetrahydropteroyltriglutamate--homocysteine S-methyltransferase [Clostridium tyrobutyricum]